jgi:hypothetical protein
MPRGFPSVEGTVYRQEAEIVEAPESQQYQEKRRKPWRLLLLLLLMLLFCFGFWTLAQELPLVADGDGDGDRHARRDAGEPTYLPERADGEHGAGNGYGPVYHDLVPPRLASGAPAPQPVTVERVVGTVGNATAPSTATLDPHRSMPRDVPMGMRYPGRVAPAKPLPAGKREVDWTFDFEGEIHHVHTTITVDGGDGLRRPAHVATYDDQGNLLVTYDGTAYLDHDGIAQVDGRNGNVSGPMADQWSPDSFAIDQYGYMHSLDDQLQTGSGWKTGGPTPK